MYTANATRGESHLSQVVTFWLFLGRSLVGRAGSSLEIRDRVTLKLSLTHEKHCNPKLLWEYP